MAKTTRVGNEKYLAGFRIIEASGLDVALRLAAEGSFTTGVPESLEKKSGTRVGSGQRCS